MLLPRYRRLIDPHKDTQFSDAWIVLSVLLTLLGLALSNPFLTTAALFLLIVPGAGWLWSFLSPYGLHYSRRFSEIRAFQGEVIDLALEVRNQKWIPLPWVTVHDYFPPDLPLDDGLLPVNPASNLADFTTFWMVGPFQRVTRHFRIHCTVRGFHKYGPATLATGDGFGFFAQTLRQETEQFLIVYPRLYSVTELRLPTKNPFGETRVRGSLYEDPMRTAGIREYRPADTLRRVHWKATARQGEMLSRVYEPTEEQVVQFFVNVATFERAWQGYIPELMERTISTAGSMAALAVEHRLSVGLSANGALPGSDQAIRVLPSRSPKQLVSILEMLAAITPFATVPIETLLLAEAPSLPWGATIVVVTAIAHDALLAALLDLASVGRRIVLFTLAEKPPERWLQSITVYHLPHLVDDLIAPNLVTGEMHPTL